MHSVHIALWLKIASCVSSHPCMRTCVLRLDCFLLACLVFYLVSLFYFQPFLMTTSAFNERSILNPLCNSSLGSVVTSDYVTPLTRLNSPCLAPFSRGFCHCFSEPFSTTAALVISPPPCVLLLLFSLALVVDCPSTVPF